MNFKTRFVLLAVFNCVLMLAMFYMFSQYGVNLSKRLIDLDLTNANERYAFLSFLGGLLIGFVVNFLILASRRTEFSFEEVGVLVDILRHQKSRLPMKRRI